LSVFSAFLLKPKKAATPAAIAPITPAPTATWVALTGADPLDLAAVDRGVAGALRGEDLAELVFDAAGFRAVRVDGFAAAVLVEAAAFEGDFFAAGLPVVVFLAAGLRADVVAGVEAPPCSSLSAMTISPVGGSTVNHRRRQTVPKRFGVTQCSLNDVATAVLLALTGARCGVAPGLLLVARWRIAMRGTKQTKVTGGIDG
jgi:hypothetical protein